MKNPQFLTSWPLTFDILTKFHKNRVKIVEFLLVTYFGAWVIFFVTVSSTVLIIESFRNFANSTYNREGAYNRVMRVDKV